MESQPLYDTFLHVFYVGMLYGILAGFLGGLIVGLAFGVTRKRK